MAFEVFCGVYFVIVKVQLLKFGLLYCRETLDPICTEVSVLQVLESFFIAERIDSFDFIFLALQMDDIRQLVEHVHVGNVVLADVYIP